MVIGRPYIFASGFLQAQARSATEIAPNCSLVVPYTAMCRAAIQLWWLAARTSPSGLPQ